MERQLVGIIYIEREREREREREPDGVLNRTCLTSVYDIQGKKLKIKNFKLKLLSKPEDRQHVEPLA